MSFIKRTNICMTENYNKTKCKWLDIPIVVLVAVLGVFAVTDMADVLSDFVRKAFFPLLSICANLMVYKMIQMVMSIKKIKLERYQWCLIAFTVVVAFASYIAIVQTREFVYYWDCGHYLSRQYDMEAAFAVDISDGIKLFINSITDDYVKFINFFTEFPFCLTSQTGDAWVVSQFVNIFAPIVLLLSLLISKLGEILNVKNKKLFFILSFVLSVSLPVLHYASSMGQPDWFGVIFCLTIIVLTIDYKFEKVDISLWLVLFMATVCLVLTRRWYLYFIVGYYSSYAFMLILGMIKEYHCGEKYVASKSFRNLFVFGVGSGCCLFVIFFKLIRHILSFNYSDSYNGFDFGGFMIEFTNQFFHVSILCFAIIIIGIVISILRKQNLNIITTNVLGYFLSLFLFTRVQNMDTHHVLMLVTFYIVLMISGIAVIVDSKKEVLRKVGVVFCCITFVFSPLTSGSPAFMYIISKPAVIKALHINDVDNLFTVYLRGAVIERTRNIEELKYVSDWIDENCEDGEFVYIMPFDDKYNEEIFRNVNFPERKVNSKICSSYGVVGTSRFPIGLFDAKYVLTCDPFPSMWTHLKGPEKLNNLFFQVKDEKFALAKTFDMGNGDTFYAYERVKNVDIEEIEYYLSAFEEEDMQFPDLYSEVVNEYIANNNDIKLQKE